MGGGTPLPSHIAIQRVCSTTVQTVAWTDDQGGFGFQWGNSSAVMLDASQSGEKNYAGVVGISPSMAGLNGGSAVGMGSAGLGAGPQGAFLHCDLRANLPGYRSDVVNLTTRHATDNPDLGLIVLHRAGAGSDGTAVSARSLAVPKPAAEAYRKAVQAERRGDKAKAKNGLLRALALYPDYAEAWMELGLIQGREQQWNESAHSLDEGLKRNPEAYPQAWYGDAMAHYYLGEFDAAERSAREAMRLDSAGRNPRVGYVLGMILAQKHDYLRAAEQLRTYLEKAPNAPDIGQVRAQLAEIESLR
jgi:tetratricopeptide (TPR) repeat protein